MDKYDEVVAFVLIPYVREESLYGERSHRKRKKHSQESECSPRAPQAADSGVVRRVG